MSKPTDPEILQFFAYAHLPPHLQAISKPFADLAHALVESAPGPWEQPEGARERFAPLPLPDNEERDVALRKLLEAKDAAVRAKLARPKCPGEGWEWDAFARQWMQPGAKGPAIGHSP